MDFDNICRLSDRCRVWRWKIGRGSNWQTDAGTLAAAHACGGASDLVKPVVSDN
jgi:hypothetical protein